MIETLLDQLAQAQHLRSDTPGICIVLSAPNHGQSSYRMGVRDSKLNPITERSNFRIASITKQFTAASILQLVENGALSLQTTLRDLFADFPRYGEAITVHHLLAHCSGLKDYKEFLGRIDTNQISDEQVLELAKRESEPVFVPGSRYAYSNSGYCILARIVAAISGISFEEYLRKNIFLPSGMTNSQLNSCSVIPDRVYGFSRSNEGEWYVNDQSRTSATQGDGGIYSSAAELLLWHKALYQNQTVLSPSYLTLMTRPQIETNCTGDYYGYGIHIAKIDEVVYFYHEGESIGFNHVLFYLPEQKSSLVVLSNVPGARKVGLPILKRLLPRISRC